MRYTHTSKPTSKCSTYTICRALFKIFSSSINKIILDAQIKEYNTKISTRQNTYDEHSQPPNSNPNNPTFCFPTTRFSDY